MVDVDHQDVPDSWMKRKAYPITLLVVVIVSVLSVANFFFGFGLPPLLALIIPLVGAAGLLIITALHGVDDRVVENTYGFLPQMEDTYEEMRSPLR